VAKRSESWRQEEIEPTRKIGGLTLSVFKLRRPFVIYVELINLCSKGSSRLDPPIDHLVAPAKNQVLKVFDVRPYYQHRGTLCCNPQQ
jgi:hypothetical protein